MHQNAAFRNMYNDFFSKIDNDSFRAIRSYTGSSYRQINSILRKTEFVQNSYVPTSKEDAKRYGELISKALGKAPKLKKNIVTHRAVPSKDLDMIMSLSSSLSGNEKELKNIKRALKSLSSESVNDQIALDAIKQSLQGVQFSDKGFLSTTTSKNFARNSHFGNLYFEFKLPKDSTPGAYIDGVSNMNGENEFLIKNGAKFFIEDVEFAKDTADAFGEIVIKCSYLE